MLVVYKQVTRGEKARRLRVKQAGVVVVQKVQVRRRASSFRVLGAKTCKLRLTRGCIAYPKHKHMLVVHNRSVQHDMEYCSHKNDLNRRHWVFMLLPRSHTRSKPIG